MRNNEITFFFTNFIKMTRRNLTYWDTKNATNMSEFMSIVSINIRGITNWNICRVRDMNHCF